MRIWGFRLIIVAAAASLGTFTVSAGAQPASRGTAVTTAPLIVRGVSEAGPVRRAALTVDPLVVRGMTEATRAGSKDVVTPPLVVKGVK